MNWVIEHWQEILFWATIVATIADIVAGALPQSWVKYTGVILDFAKALREFDLPKKSKPTGTGMTSVILAIMLLSGCATMDGIDTQEKKYLVCRAELNLLIEQYIGMQNDIPDDTHLAIKVAFESGDTALDVWESNLAPDYDFSGDYQQWLQIKSRILHLLQEVYDV